MKFYNDTAFSRRNMHLKEVLALKKRFIAVLSFVFMFALVLFGCNSIRLSGGPNANDTVYGNGGSAVVKGDYLYFANAFLDYSTLGHNDNIYDAGSKYTIYGIYRTKLNSNGKVDVDSDGVPTKADLLTYNVGGYEYSGLYIFGNYLYYTTPYTNTTSSNEKKTGRVRVERVALDGTSHEVVYKFEDYTSDCKYNMVYIDGKVYIVYFTKDKDIKLITVDARKNVKESTIASSVESYAVFKQEDIEKDNNVEDINKYVYYVVKENDSDYVIYRKNLLTKEEETFYRGSTSEIVLKEVKNNLVYYTENNHLYSRFDSNTYSDYSLPTTSSDEDTGYISSYLTLDAGLRDKGLIAVLQSNSKYYVNYYNGKTCTEIELSSDKSKSITLVATKNNFFLYQIADDTSLYRCDIEFDYSSGRYSIAETSISTIATSFSSSVGEDSETTMLDYDNDRIYVYKQVNDSTICYLTMYMTRLDNVYTNDSGEIVGQYIGNLK